MSLSAFYKENVVNRDEEEFVLSDRFQVNGQPVAWKLRSMTEDENEECRKAATKRVKGKNGQYSMDVDPSGYMAKLVVSSVVFPDLKDPGLQQSYGVMGAENLLRKMLLPGEYTSLVLKVQEINGFDQEISDLVDEVKN